MDNSRNKLSIPDSYIPIISIEQYRVATSDQTTSDELITQRIFYIERLCRGVIQQELRNTHTMSDKPKEETFETNKVPKM